LGGVIAIVFGLVLAGMAWGKMWPRSAFVSWISPQQLLSQWVVGCLIVGGVLLVGGARAAGDALVASSAFSVLAALTSRLYGGDHLETLVHGAVILGSVGLVVFGLRGLRRRPRAPLGRYPMALALGAIGTVVVGRLLILRIHAGLRGFEDPWLRPLLAFNVAFLALLFLVQARQATRSSGKHEREDDTDALDWLLRPFAGGGPPFFL
jgi:hypothetical protein